MINKAIIIGNLGAAPEARQTKTGSSVATFNVATTSRWKGLDGQQKEQTEWHRVVAFSRLGEICSQYLGKGSKVYIEGRIQTQQWNDRDGNKRYTTQIVAQEMKILDSQQVDNRAVKPERKSTINDWPPPSEPSSKGSSVAFPEGGPFTGDDVPF